MRTDNGETSAHLLRNTFPLCLGGVIRKWTEKLCPLATQYTRSLTSVWAIYPSASFPFVADNGHFVMRHEFRAQQKLRPLPIFPDVDKVYESKELWSFFRMRVPSLKQPSIRRIVDEQNIDSKDQVKLLKHFGRRTISNPFELVPESAPSEAITTG